MSHTAGKISKQQGTVYVPLYFNRAQYDQLTRYLQCNAELLQLAQDNGIYHPAPVLSKDAQYFNDDGRHEMLICVDKGNPWLVVHLLKHLMGKGLLSEEDTRVMLRSVLGEIVVSGTVDHVNK